jgi:hypothetical protein
MPKVLSTTTMGLARHCINLLTLALISHASREVAANHCSWQHNDHPTCWGDKRSDDCESLKTSSSPDALILSDQSYFSGADVAGFTIRKETPSELTYFLQILMVNGFDAASFIKFDPPTTWGSSSNDKSMAITIFGDGAFAPCARSDAITQRQRMGRFNQYVRFGTHVPGYFRVWPGVIVEENTLEVHISVIRKALGPDREMLNTASGRGYRLLGAWTSRQECTSSVDSI